MRKLWIGLAAGLFVSFAAASAGGEAPVRAKQRTTADPVPRAADKEALLRLFLLVGLARRQ